MHPILVNVWFRAWVGDLIGPFFFGNTASQTITVNGARYHDMIFQFFGPIFQDITVEGIWFQQDSQICNIAGEKIQLLHQSFPDHVISCFSIQN